MTIAYHQKRDKSEELPNQRLETIEALKKKFTVTKPDFPAMLCKTIEILIQYHGCPYTAKTDHDSPIMKATFNMDIEILKSMCKATPSENAHINTLNELGQTPLLVAIDNISNHIKKKEAFDIEVVKSLLDTGADPNIQYGDGNTLFMKAISTSNALLAQTILEHSKVELQHHLKNKRK
jgi:ankyrin repeat protein